ncbi:hypothetical protein GCM10007377_12230 [Galliscardovia ingluviei]|uniref:Colicin transporter n=1 Tax=Galliscardovia ingluviei TaxID=1769422 RepID=A0A8J3AKY6_9BIFI|nr:colicin transporter [Galliscardovia ingluviei]GGI14700.1 hypothetical protein GCM10007377_12230 [Galliscardovia ingluviei]
MEEHAATTQVNEGTASHAATTQVNESTASHEATTAQEQTTDTTPVPSAQGKCTLIIAISIIIALLAAVGVYAGVTVHENHARESAYSQAQKVDKQLVKSVNTATPLAKLDKRKVADAKVLTELQRALDDAKANLGVSQQDVNQALLWQALSAKQAYAQDADTASQLRDKLDKAIKKVNASVEAKQLADAKQALTDRVNAAQQSLTDSDGKVADNATRDQLQAAIDNANKLLANKQATVKQLQEEPAKLDNAINTVNQSVEAKRQADEEAARKAAEEEAARQAAAAAQAQQTYSTPRNYSYNGGGYSRGGYTAPRNSGGGNYSAPQPQSSGGGFGGFIGGGEGVKPDGSWQPGHVIHH